MRLGPMSIDRGSAAFCGNGNKGLDQDVKEYSEFFLTRIEMSLREVNEEPVVFDWKYKLETLSVV